VADCRYSGFERLLLYLDAVRGMRARQIAWRVRRLIPPILLAMGIRVGSPRAPRLVAARLGCSPAPQSGPTEPPHKAGAFAGYGTSRRFDQPRFWEDPCDGLLFLFHLHGFTPLAEYARGERTSAGDAFWARVVESWLERHDRPSNPAWHPYPTSLRIISWSAALSTIEDWPAALRDRIAAAILRQALYLRRAVEHDVGGNHVIKNGTALAFAGALFPSSGLMQSALNLLNAETTCQILPDGGHEERSTSYHREVFADLEDVRTLVVRSGGAAPGWLDERLSRMKEWSATLAGPDGLLPLLNDAWEGPPVERRAQASFSALADTGYVILRHGADQLVFDTGALCPAHLPPHAHADALSVLLWLDGRPVIVDPGTYSYTGPERDRFRSTRAHATVSVDDEDQCVFWGDFRAGRLPHVERAGPWQDGPLTLVSGWHDGYTRLDDPVVHERTIAWWPGRGVAVLDRLHCQEAHAVRSTLPCAPGEEIGEELRVGEATIASVGGGTVESLAMEYSPQLGVKLPAWALVDTRPAVAAGVLFGWGIFRDGGRVVSVTGDQVVVEAAGLGHAFRAFGAE
jgi:hypothetical protein